MFERLRRRFRPAAEIVNIVPGQRLRLSGKVLCLRNPGQPLRIEMGRQTLDLYPDRPLTREAGLAELDWLLLDPARDCARIGYQIRLTPGSRFVTNADSKEQSILFSAPREAFRRHLKIVHDGEVLNFSDPISELGTYLSLVEEPVDLVDLRHRALCRVVAAYGGPLEPLPADRALDLVRRVNDSLATAPGAKRDANGNPGGLVEIAADTRSVVIGDLHGQVDNLLSVLSENAFLSELDRGTAVIVIVGDAVQSDRPGQLESMESSALMMDVLFSLMLTFPGRVVFLLGNHDSFSPEVMKGGVSQGVLWERYLSAARGADYVAEMTRFYQLCPLVALSPYYLACHAGPPGAAVSRELLVEARQNPHLVHELTWSRLRNRRFPSGYGRSDVRRFLKSLGLAPGSTFIVGHYPLSDDDTLWTDIGNIPGHHLVYSSAEQVVGLFVQIDDKLVPMRYPVEPLLDWTNRYLVDDEYVDDERRHQVDRNPGQDT